MRRAFLAAKRGRPAATTCWCRGLPLVAVRWAGAIARRRSATVGLCCRCRTFATRGCSWRGARAAPRATTLLCAVLRRTVGLAAVFTGRAATGAGAAVGGGTAFGAGTTASVGGSTTVPRGCGTNVPVGGVSTVCSCASTGAAGCSLIACELAALVPAISAQASAQGKDVRILSSTLPLAATGRSAAQNRHTGQKKIVKPRLQRAMIFASGLGQEVLLFRIRCGRSTQLKKSIEIVAQAAFRATNEAAQTQASAGI
jgi:hypothetical protein